MSLYSEWAHTEHGVLTRIATSVLAGILFVIVLPFVVVRGGPAIDRRLGVPRFATGSLNQVLGGILSVGGLAFAWWSVLVQLTKGRGTPVPVVPTQELLTEGPFGYCRNPMTLGTVLAYLGLGILAGTVAGTSLVLLFAALLVLYLTRVEERELEERFGEAYRRYKEEVPFIIPRVHQRK